jgi:hypothetical protein
MIFLSAIFPSKHIPNPFMHNIKPFQIQIQTRFRVQIRELRNALFLQNHRQKKTAILHQPYSALPTILKALTTHYN